MSSGVNIGINTKDFKEVQLIFDKLGHKVGKKELLKVFRKAAKPLIDAARSSAPVGKRKAFFVMQRSASKGKYKYRLSKHGMGTLKRSIGAVAGRGLNAALYIGPRSGKKGTVEFNAWYAHFVEYGTRGYTVKKDTKIPTPGGIVTLKAGTFVPGQRPQAFMRKAWDSANGQSYQIIRAELKALFTKIMNK
jgi:HK97 gp10 family phage protein